MELKLINELGQAAGSLVASDELFAREYNESLVHQVVTAYMANARSGDRAQKDRRTVKHSTKKPWRQKGTGRARSGMTSSPIWRGGGRAFPNSPEENFSQKVNRKMYRAGVASILSKLASEGRLSVVESMAMATPKTKDLANKLKSMGYASRVMIVTDDLDDNLWMSSRNLPNVLVVEARHIDPVSMVHFSNVLMTKNAVKMIEEMLG
ncbi:MAG: 50S ribosomal protein L4 [Pseudomonadota bacterium]|uniref:50S ribosomal protein L4 n=1 Tax=Sulfuriferula sp. TaxID=2025307 RepID=UPI0027307B03|nr:50S ribosomal protein L4 [Sulfuriferula sp.]MDP2025934.1 50S ribosomal protein L4 [Sulfuriferula sp.]